MIRTTRFDAAHEPLATVISPDLFSSPPFSLPFATNATAVGCYHPPHNTRHRHVKHPHSPLDAPAIAPPQLIVPKDCGADLERFDGTLVEIGLRIFKVQHVDTSSGSLRLKVWLRLRWTDLRLAWDPADFGNVTQTHARCRHHG